MAEQYNVLIDFVGAILVGAIILSEHCHQQRGDRLTSRFLHVLLFCCIAVFLTDIPGLLLDGHMFPGARALLWIFDTAYWMFQIVFCWLWLLFSDYWAFGSASRLKMRMPLYTLPMIIELLLILTTGYTGWIFTINDQNVYRRGSLYVVNMLPYILYIGAALLVTLSGYFAAADPEKKRRKLIFVVFMFLPSLGVMFDVFVYGISWVWPMVSLTLLMVYLSVQQQNIAEEQLAAAKMESELIESRVAIMLSQIQPHFLFNALCVIQNMCHGKAPEAEEAAREFSEFLRGNLDSLSAAKPISFEQELNHVKNYLSLEQKRFGDRLNIEYDIESKLFRLPALTLQPIAENAVRHGVMHLENGGTVRITAKETDSEYIVTVSDNGEGFDVEKPLSDSRSHVGIQNVRDRISKMCNGTLEIKSAVGKGTTAVISIPKGDAQ